MQTHYVRLIKDKHKSTKGVTRTNSTYLTMIKRQQLLKVIHGITWFDYTFFALLLIVSGALFFVVKPINISFILSISTFLLYCTSGILMAKGKLIGAILALVNNFVYITICVMGNVYGEILINAGLYVPLSIMCIVLWKKNQTKQTKELVIRSLNWKQILVWFLCVAAASGLFYLVLGVWWGQTLALLNAISISINASGDILRNLRYKQFWYSYILGNALTIALWLTLSASDLSLLPVAFSCFFSIINSIRGLFSWQNLWRKSQVYQGKILAKRKINIQRIIKLKHRFQRMKWKVGT